MTMEYDLNKQLKDLETVLDEYTEWFMRVIRCISYPEPCADLKKFEQPDSFSHWVEEAQKANFQPELLKRLSLLNADWTAQVEKLVKSSVQLKKAPEYAEFNQLVTFFEEFIHHIRRLERDCLLGDSGVDILTGLRSQATLEKDVNRELDRLIRQGKPFSLALVRLDNLQDIKKLKNQELVDGYLKLIASFIKKSVRSFDDAYRLDNDEFALSLKQADMSGGIRALERLKREMQSDGGAYEVNGKRVPMSVSSCIAEPMPGDNVHELLKNLRADLDTTKESDGNVLEYFEMSPLQRFIKESKD